MRRLMLIAILLGSAGCAAVKTAPPVSAQAAPAAPPTAAPPSEPVAASTAEAPSNPVVPAAAPGQAQVPAATPAPGPPVPSPMTVPAPKAGISPRSSAAATARSPPPVSPAPPAPPAAPPAAASAAVSAAATARPAAPPQPPTRAAPAQPTLNLADLEQRLRDTHAIGLMTKLSLKNQVDDLLKAFRVFYKGPDKHPTPELRQRFDLLLLKVLSLLQDGDPPLAAAIASSREAIWNILADPEEFAKI
jgi:hypothetical protein